jgi:hypothetical protein
MFGGYVRRGQRLRTMEVDEAEDTSRNSDYLLLFDIQSFQRTTTKFVEENLI